MSGRPANVPPVAFGPPRPRWGIIIAVLAVDLALAVTGAWMLSEGLAASDAAEPAQQPAPASGGAVKTGEAAEVAGKPAATVATGDGRAATGEVKQADAKAADAKAADAKAADTKAADAKAADAKAADAKQPDAKPAGAAAQSSKKKLVKKPPPGGNASGPKGDPIDPYGEPDLPPRDRPPPALSPPPPPRR
jgi:hypothetical protein